VRVALDRQQLGQRDRAGLRDTPDVVAVQVHQHHVLGAVFGVGLQVVGQGRVGHWVGAAPPGARQRAAGHGAVGHVHQNLGARPHQHRAAGLQIEHVRRGVNHPQRAVHVKRVGRGRAFETLRLA